MSKAPALTETQKVEALAMLAEGLSKPQVAEKLGVSGDTIRRLAKTEENSRLIAQLRESIRVRTLKRVRKLAPKVLELAEGHAGKLGPGKVPVQDSASLDALARAALSLEKVASSASGEALKVAQAQAGVLIQVAPWASAKPPATVQVLDLAGESSLAPEK